MKTKQNSEGSSLRPLLPSGKKTILRLLTYADMVQALTELCEG